MRWLIVLSMLIGAVVVAVTPSPSIADGCLVRNRQVYQQSAYVVPYAGYTNNIAHHGNYNYNNVKVLEVLASPAYYYSVQNYYAEKLLADSIVGRILEAQKNGLIGGVPQTPPQGGIVPTNPMAPVGPKVGVQAGPYQEEKLLAVVNQSCASCHSGGVAKGGFTILSDDGKLADLDEKMVWKTMGLVTSGDMPRGGKPVADESIPLFFTWAKEVSKTAKK